MIQMMVRGVLLMGSCAALGCGSGAIDDQPETAKVIGVVTLDNQPLAGARIYFRPEEGGQTSEAVTNEDGSYELRYKRDIMGAKIGKHKIVITTFEEGGVGDDGQPLPNVEEQVPAKYNTETTLSEEVKAGENKIDFPLTSN